MPLYIEGIAGIGKTSVVRDLKGIYGDYGDFIKDYPHFKHKSQNAHQEAFFQFFFWLNVNIHSFMIVMDFQVFSTILFGDIRLKILK